MVQFKVNDVDPDLKWVNSGRSVNGKQQAKDLAGVKSVEGFSHPGATFVNNNLGVKNPLIAAVYLAFAHHLPLTLTPDVIWNTIMQGVSTHVSKDPEKHRHTFVNHKGKETLKVRHDILLKGSPANNWDRIACRFTDLIAEKLSGKAALQALHTRFTTTDDFARVAHAIVFMDVVKSYFEFPCRTACGIPSIELTGTKEDWSQMRSALVLLDELELTSWRTQLDSILSHFEDAFDDRFEHSFWNDIFLKHGARMSGGVTMISGWIGALFLYVDEKLNPVALGEAKVRLDPKNFSSGLSETPFTWEYVGGELKMLMRGGLVGVVVDPASHAVAPQLGWLVTKADDYDLPTSILLPEDYFTVKEIKGVAVDQKQHYDLVEEMSFLFIRVVRARNLIAKDNNGLRDSYVRVSVGPVKAQTKIMRFTLDPEWNQVFAIDWDKNHGGVCELSVLDADKMAIDDFLGGFMIDLREVPARKPPESWYELFDKVESKAVKGRIRGDVMVAIWWGTQADEAFPDAWKTNSGGKAQFRSKVYFSPKLCYLRVNVIEAQVSLVSDRMMAEPSVTAQFGPYQRWRTSRSITRGNSPFWNEDLLFVAAEPCDEWLNLIFEDNVDPGKREVVGQVLIPFMSIERRIDGRPVDSSWYVLEREGGTGASLGRIHLRLCIEGGYHVMDESPKYISDTRPTDRQLWRPSLGVLDLGIHGANELLPMKITTGTTDAYCVAKYGPKWIRTRTIIDSLNPRWNEQYSWEVYDPCTVLTVGVFDDRQTGRAGPNRVGKDLPIGKVRIRLSTLESDRVYTNAYPLLMVTPQGIKKMGEVELAVRFSSAAAVNVMHAYLQPQLPKMHFFYPIDPRQEETLRVAAMNIVALRLMSSKPPLRQETVQFILDADGERWSMRRSRANYHRIMGLVSGIVAVMNWFTDICNWESPVTTVVVHILFLIVVVYPELLLPTVFLYWFLSGVWSYRFRSRAPPFIDARLSQGEYIGSYFDELEEEFNVVPANRAVAVMLKLRYERLRGVASRLQNAFGDIASIGEKLQSLRSWHDPRATSIFITFCLVAAFVLYVTPFQVIVVLLGVYTLRHPWFRDPLPAVPVNFFKRLPTLSDRIL